jgi:hypothetical protein
VLLLACICVVFDEGALVDLATLELLDDHFRIFLALSFLFAKCAHNSLLGHDARHTSLLSFELLVLVSNL